MARLVFLGSPEPAATCLSALVGAGHDVALVVTEVDKRRGRGGTTSPTPVKRTALELGLATTEHVADVLAVEADLGVVVAFGRLIRPAVLDRLDMVNVHFSLLPLWRGAAPVERAILAGDTVTGVSLMKLEEGLDTGPVYSTESTPIFPHESAATLRERLAAMGADLLIRGLDGGAASLGHPQPQSGEATYAPKIAVDELHIDWSSTADAAERIVRIGRAWTTFRGARLIVWEAQAVGKARAVGDEHAQPAAPESAGSPESAPGTVSATVDGTAIVTTGSGPLELRVVQPEGRKRQTAADWFRGARLAEGDAFV